MSQPTEKKSISGYRTRIESVLYDLDHDRSISDEQLRDYFQELAEDLLVKAEAITLDIKRKNDT